MKKSLYLLGFLCVLSMLYSCSETFLNEGPTECADLVTRSIPPKDDTDLSESLDSIPLIPKDPPSDKPMDPTGGVFYSEEDFTRVINSEITLSWLGRIGTGVLNTNILNLDDSKVINLSDKIHSIEYSVTAGIITFSVDESWKDILENRSFIIRYQDKYPTIYHSGGNYYGFYYKYIITVNFR